MNKKILCLVAVTLLSVGCASKGQKDGAGSAANSSSNGTITQGSGNQAERDAQNRALSANLVANAGLAKVFYFEFDSEAIKAQDADALKKWGALLAGSPMAKIRLEGHADERGTPEYNIALGERRGNAVRDALVKAGATAEQLSVISYGESRPVDPSHSDMAWNLNRRVEITEIK